MAFYFIKRLFLFIPTLLLLSLFFFYLSKLSPGDPMLQKLEQQKLTDRQEEMHSLDQLRQRFGLHHPTFYFSVHRKSSSDTLNRISNQTIKSNLQNWAYQCGSWNIVNDFYKHCKKLIFDKNLSLDEKKKILQLLQTASIKNINEKNLNTPLFDPLKEKLSQMKETNLWWHSILLNVKWNGLTNQYHNWLKGIIIGDFGTSYQDGRSVNTKISEALKWTLILSLSSLLISLLIATPLAVYTAFHPNSFLDKAINTFFLGLYSIPNFWVATLLIIYFTGGDYFDLFPSYGVGQVPDKSSWIQSLQIRFSHLVLPVICISYGSFAFLFKQLRNSMKKELVKPYIQTAQSKGLPIKTILWKHAFRNASLPFITLLGKAFPLIISGSFVIEYIFSINGMGKLTLESFVARDYPIIFGILMIASLLTLVGNWLADIFYQFADPRISIGTNK